MDPQSAPGLNEKSQSSELNRNLNQEPEHDQHQHKEQHQDQGQDQDQGQEQDKDQEQQRRQGKEQSRGPGQSGGQVRGKGRIPGLDALRGLAILLMVLSGIIPFVELPAWMYHIQIPPPDHIFNPEIRGIGWVDLVFPLFLFSMGVAIPLAFTRRFNALGPASEGMPGIWAHRLRQLGRVAERGFLLGFFAIFLQHVRPYALQPSGEEAWAWWTGMAGMTLLFLIYTRLPSHWPGHITRTIRAVGFIGAILLMAFLTFPDGSGFSLYRSDIILIVLTNMAVFTTLIWLATRRRPGVRFSILAILAALMLSANEPGWISSFWSWSPVPWLFQFDYLKYLFILIPATIIGDEIISSGSGESGRYKDIETNVSSSAGGGMGASKAGWMDNLFKEKAKYHGVAAAGMVLTIVILAGLVSRHVFATLVAALVLMAGAFLLLRSLKGGNVVLFRRLLLWGAFWLVLGLCLEPFQGGIRKDHATFSYFFVTAGVSVWLLVSFMVWTDELRGEGVLSLLISNGRNPMIAYAGMQNFLLSVLVLTGLHDFLLQITAINPWVGVARAAIYTLVLAWLVMALTRRQIYWKT